MKIFNKNGLPYSLRVLFTPGVVILPIYLIFLNPGFLFQFSALLLSNLEIKNSLYSDRLIKQVSLGRILEKRKAIN